MSSSFAIVSIVPPLKDKKKTRWIRLIFGIVCVLSVLASLLMLRLQPPRAAQSVQVITSDWDPYVTTSDENGGVVGNIVLSVLASSGYNGQVSFDTWDSGLQKVEAGTVFGVFPMVKSASRFEKYEYSDPLVDFRYVLFKRRDSNVTQAMRNGDLSNVRIGKIDGYDYWAALDNSGAEFSHFSSPTEGFQALQNGEVDLLAESDLVGNAILRSPDFQGDSGMFEILEGDATALSSEDSVHFLVRKNKLSRGVIDSFNESLAEYKKTDRYREQISLLKGIPERVSLSGEGLIDVHDESGRLLGSVPAGVSAQVLAWPDDLKEGQVVKIKMLSGPMVGRIGLVKLESVEISDVQS